jgi:histidinol dehydrogenase
MKKYNKPLKDQWKEIIQRPARNASSVRNLVSKILVDVQNNGDNAIRKYNLQFDEVDLMNFTVSEDEIKNSIAAVSPELAKAITIAASNIRKFHQQDSDTNELVETMPGVQCWRRSVSIEKVGLYIPGGTAPLFSTVLMLGIPAKLAGCEEIILCTPCNKQGNIHPSILFAAHYVGITRIYKIGGAQAVAAMAYGTETVPPVYKIFGPGNQFVTTAKQLVQSEGIAIDMPAGPSELCVVADDTADPKFIAADLLSQAEHGVDSQVILITTSSELVVAVEEQLILQLNSLPRKNIAEEALSNSRIVFVESISEAIELANEYAPEHLIICCDRDEVLAAQVKNAGSVFLGNYSPESAGDYASGTNHTLPTNGFARSFSGVNVESFSKTITYQKLSGEGLKNIAETIITMATAEGLQAHANAVKIRTNV